MRPFTIVSGLSVLLAITFRGTSARAANWTVPSIYSNWSFGSGAGYPSFTQRLIVARDPGSSVMRFWSAQFFTSAPGGNGGYLGIQDGAPRTDGTTGKLAIFSFWGASGATPGAGARCQTFGGEGTGYSCHLDYGWAQGHPYVLSVASTGAGEWRGSIQDEATASHRSSAPSVCRQHGDSSPTGYTTSPKTSARTPATATRAAVPCRPAPRCGSPPR